jgi:hypothetical protein
MNQTQHIFLKDARRFWGESVLSLTITVALVFLAPLEWISRYQPQDGSLIILAGLVTVLVPVSWWIAITRVVHDERLVGDTQFWITRPYAWTSLLAAKVAFVLAFLYVPLFLAQLAVLAEAGFAPLAYLPGLLYNLLLISAVIVLPLAAIASVTSSFARMTLTLLGVFVALIAFQALTSLASSYWTLDAHQYWAFGAGLSLDSRISLVLSVAVFAAAIVLQYARRAVWSSRWLLIALPLLLLAVSFLSSKYEQAQINRIYATAQTGAPIQLTYSPVRASYETASFKTSPREQIPIKIPLAESGVSNGSMVLFDAVRIELNAPNGLHWDSQWQNSGGEKFLPGELPFSLTFWMPVAEYRKFKGTPLRAHFTLAISYAQASKVTNMPLPWQRFSVPDFGVCSPQTGWAPELGHITGIACVTALRNPPLTYISTQWSDLPCAAATSAPERGKLGAAWVGALERGPVQLGISPVVEAGINLSNGEHNTERGQNEPRYLCPGTPVTFTQYARVGRMQTSVDVPTFSLPEYSVTGNMITITQ